MRHLLLLAGIIGLLPAFGCAMCDRCDDYNYGAYGGIRTRDDQQNGRVGSVFQPADSVSDDISPPMNSTPKASQKKTEPAPEVMEETSEMHESPAPHSARRGAWRPY